MGHHGEKARAFQVQVSIDADDGITAYFYLFVSRLQVELLDGWLIGRGMVGSEISDIDNERRACERRNG